ncbi:unnamed protein product [Blepharisma stoltei]|uniref:RNA-dependent RNA polymerase n=1 Tax=Blepharisma stoltei TaxID=1481888 RepID=A0AAU9IFJ8_9CILI|nr:unnamed protein product [Blepharisma stoltei]
MLNYSETIVKDFPENWDAVDIKDFLTPYGDVIRVKMNGTNAAFVTFDERGLNRDIFSNGIMWENRVIDIQEIRGNFRLRESIPHCYSTKLNSGIPNFHSENTQYSIAKYKGLVVCKIYPSKEKLEILCETNKMNFKLTISLEWILYWAYEDKGNKYKIFLQFNKPPMFYWQASQRKRKELWTIDHAGKGWWRTGNFFKGFNDFLIFESKKIGIKLKVLKSGSYDFLKFLREKVKFKENVPKSIDLPEDLVTFKDLDKLEICYQTKFMLYSIISLGYISVFDLNKDFLKELIGQNQEQICSGLQWVISNNRDFPFETIPDFITEFWNLVHSGYDFPKDNYLRINRVIVTPATFYVLIGEPGNSNRVTRNPEINKENLLRISFADEDLDKLYINKSEALVNIIRDNLSQFHLAGKTFYLLGYSNSQLKETSAWLLSPQGQITPEYIRDWLGDFSKIKIPGKYSARVGQSLATSRHMFNLDNSQIKRIPDIEVGKYNFSDGIGMISKDLANEINKKTGQFSSAFQFRLGGYKGVVAVDDRLPGRQLALRKSQKKFKSDKTGFDLLDQSEFRYGHLNRQLILLLNTLGIQDDIFNDLLDEALIHLDKNCKEYVRKLNYKSIAIQRLQQVLDHPYEPIVVEMRNLLKSSVLQELKLKQRIWVENSGLLMGVLDEKKVLEYGQVFVQIQGLGVITGPVIVGKNPCLHPGDIRVLYAVEAPELMHLFDVLVFPQKGPRPHTNECSGSDLDGDLYFVSWDNRLIPEPVAPMEYDTVKPKTKEEIFGQNTLIKFFLKYAKNEKLGLIDNAHVAIADQSPLNANDDKCLELCKLHAIAVDFSKNGIKVEIDKDLIPKEYPTFMERKGRSYKSEKIIGKLYERITEIVDEDIPQFNIKYSYDRYEAYMPQAAELFNGYRVELNLLLNQFGLEREIELLIGQPVNISIYQKTGIKAEDMRESVTQIANELIEKYREKFNEKASFQLAVACYHVSHTSDPPLRAFPWIVCTEFLYPILYQDK